MVQFADTSLQGIDTFSTCPAQINGFFKYESRGIPTPELIDNILSLADIKDQIMIDNTMYAVFHMATSYVSWEELKGSFIMQFTLGHPKKCVYVVSVENITDPLFFFRTMEMMDWTIFAHYPTNIGVLILEKDFLIELIIELYCIILVF